MIESAAFSGERLGTLDVWLGYLCRLDFFFPWKMGVFMNQLRWSYRKEISSVFAAVSTFHRISFGENARRTVNRRLSLVP